MDSCYVIPTERFAGCIAGSKRVRWDIDGDVIRGRRFDRTDKFLPDGLTLASRLDFLSPEHKRYFSQVQGRTYANMFGLVERFINAKVLELTHEPLVRGSDSARGAGSVRRRRAEAPGIIPAS